MKDYLPSNDAELLIWLHNFNKKMAMHGYNLGLSSESLSEINMQSNSLSQAVQDVATKKEEVAQAVTYKNDVRTAFLTNLRKEIARIKTHRNYTESLGQEVGIIGTSTSFDPTNYKPELKVEVTGGVVRIKFKKKGVDGVNIYRRRKGEAVWHFLARDTRSPYEDRIQLEDPSKPEHWEYRAYGVINDEEIGQPSDVVEVIFGV